MKLKTKLKIYNALYTVSVIFMVCSIFAGLGIGFIAGPLGMIIGGFAGFALGLIPAGNFAELSENVRKELEEENQPYRFRSSDSWFDASLSVSSTPEETRPDETEKPSPEAGDGSNGGPRRE